MKVIDWEHIKSMYMKGLGFDEISEMLGGTPKPKTIKNRAASHGWKIEKASLEIQENGLGFDLSDSEEMRIIKNHIAAAGGLREKAVHALNELDFESLKAAELLAILKLAVEIERGALQMKAERDKRAAAVDGKKPAAIVVEYLNTATEVEA